jgi:hypothetical protein
MSALHSLPNMRLFSFLVVALIGLVTAHPAYSPADTQVTFTTTSATIYQTLRRDPK